MGWFKVDVYLGLSIPVENRQHHDITRVIAIRGRQITQREDGSDRPWLFPHSSGLSFTHTAWFSSALTVHHDQHPHLAAIAVVAEHWAAAAAGRTAATAASPAVGLFHSLPPSHPPTLPPSLSVSLSLSLSVSLSLCLSLCLSLSPSLPLFLSPSLFHLHSSSQTHSLQLNSIFPLSLLLTSTLPLSLSLAHPPLFHTHSLSSLPHSLVALWQWRVGSDGAGWAASRLGCTFKT
jgi:hypothetical protein